MTWLHCPSRGNGYSGNNRIIVGSSVFYAARAEAIEHERGKEVTIWSEDNKDHCGIILTQLVIYYFSNKSKDWAYLRIQIFSVQGRRRNDINFLNLQEFTEFNLLITMYPIFVCQCWSQTQALKLSQFVTCRPVIITCWRFWFCVRAILVCLVSVSFRPINLLACSGIFPKSYSLNNDNVRSKWVAFSEVGMLH
jgi:hypothetical protein